MGSILIVLRKVALLAAYVCVIVAGVSFGVPRWHKLSQLKKQHASLQATIAEREKSLAMLKRNRDRMNSDVLFVEMILHENRRIRPGEILFIINDSEGP